MNTAENAYAASSFDGPVRRNQYISKRKSECSGKEFDRVHPRKIPQRRTRPTSKAGILFRPRPSRSCSNPAISTYGCRFSRLSTAKYAFVRIAKVAVVCAVVAAVVLAARTITQTVMREAAMNQMVESISSSFQTATDPVSESERQALIDRLVASPADYTSQISAVLQGEEYPSGCEPAALASVLESMGVEASLESVIAYLDIDPDFIDFVYHYAGDPAGDGSAWPQAMVDTANRYLADAGSSSSESASDASSGESGTSASLLAVNISGASFDELEEIMAAGYPVMVWTTTYMEDPAFSDYEIFGYQFVTNNHCVVAYGISDDGESVLVMDSLEGLVERDIDAFAEIYEERGCLAMVVVPEE